MHTSNSQIVEVIVSQSDSTDENCYHTTHIEELSNHIAENTKKIGNNNLKNLAFCQISQFAENERANQGYIG
jgi:hypothetical protein